MLIVHVHPLHARLVDIKSEVGCWGDTVPKTVDTRKVGLRACNNLPQPLKTRSREGVVEDCCMHSTLPCNAFLCLLFLARCHPYILLHFSRTHAKYAHALCVHRAHPAPVERDYYNNGRACA